VNTASCARPGCAKAPAAWLAYDYGARCAWLDDQADDGTGKVGRWPLCERHANNLRVPRGWFCVDRRGGQFATGSVDLDGPGAQGTLDGAASAGGGHVDRPDGEAGDVEQPGRGRRSSAARLTAIL
jgi:Protein of unknown function (DUF3499)